MKRWMILLLAAALALGAAGCSEAENPAQPESAPAAARALEEESEPDTETKEELLYRGTLEDFAVDDEGRTVLILRQAASGINYGYPRLQVTLTEDTALPEEDVANGDYLEARVLLTDPGDENRLPTGDAVSLKKIFSEEGTNFSGTIQSVTEQSDTEGTLLLEGIGNQTPYLFHYDADTLLADGVTLAEGEQIAIYFSGIAATSYPPQSTALEIYPYWPGEVVACTGPMMPAGQSETAAAASLPEETRAPADAARYRGVVEEISARTDSGVTVLLAQAAGTDFGAARLSAVIPAEEIPEDLAVGDYLEIYYGGSLPQSETPQVTAIQANEMPPAEICLFGGEVVSVTADSDGTGSVLLRQIGGENEQVFHYDDSTSCYLPDPSQWQPGDRVMAVYDGVSTRSLPPQSNASEFWPYHDAQ